MTARWVVEEVAPERELRIRWQPISLLVKNGTAEDSPAYPRVRQTHRYLRVMEALRRAEGDDAVFPFYWELGRRIHHDKVVEFDVADALEAAGFDRSLADAFDDDRWDDEIDSRMAAGLALVGDDVGTPIIALVGDDGERTALFGPVITRVPDRQDSLRLWDCFVTLTTLPGFWELKRTRTERPDLGDRP